MKNIKIFLATIGGALLTMLLLINALFPKTLMGRLYIKDFEKQCYEPHYYDVVSYDRFCNSTKQDWEQSEDRIEWFQKELEGTVIRISTSYNIDCYVYEDVEDSGVLWCTVDGYAKGKTIVGNYAREYGTLTDIEEKAMDEALKTWNHRVNDLSAKQIKKLQRRCNYTVGILGGVWLMSLIGIIVFRRISKNGGYKE